MVPNQVYSDWGHISMMATDDDSFYHTVQCVTQSKPLSSHIDVYWTALHRPRVYVPIKYTLVANVGPQQSTNVTRALNSGRGKTELAPCGLATRVAFKESEDSSIAPLTYIAFLLCKLCRKGLSL